MSELLLVVRQHEYPKKKDKAENQKLAFRISLGLIMIE